MPRCFLILVAFSFSSMASAADWPQFRGPGSLGVAPAEKGLPTTWSDKDNLLWKKELPGAGASSPIVVGDRIFLTCYSGYGIPGAKGGDIKDLKRHLLCLDRKGEVLWSKEVVSKAEDYPYKSFQGLHGYASATPASDGKHVFCFFGVAGVAAFDLDGKELWRESVGTGTSDWGSGNSPVLHKDLVIINASVESGSLVALDKASGKQRWAAKGISSSWNTPILVDAEGRKEVVVSIKTKLRAFDPESGTELWSCQGISDYVCPSVVAHDGVVFAIGGRGNTALAVKAGGKGDVTTTHVLWRIKKGSNVSSPVYHEGHLYWAHEGRGVVYCVDAKKGEVVYEKDLAPSSDRIYASGTLGDGKIYYVSRNQGTYVVAASPEFKQLAHNRFASDKSVFNASPALVDGLILLRSDRFLYCLGAK